MKFHFLLVTIICFGVRYNVKAQDKTVQDLKKTTLKQIKKDPADTIPLVWRKGGLSSVAISQGSLSNWAAGGDDFSLSVNAYLNLFAFYKKERHSWDNVFDLNFGYVKTTSLGSRKNDDRFDLLSKYGYALDKKWNLSSLFEFRSQLFKGYTYPDNQKKFSSAFLSPGYLTLGIGFDYKPNNKLSVFLSPVTSRWTMVLNDSLSARGLYGVDSGSHIKNELGAFTSVNYQTSITEIITYKGKLDLFSNYRHNPQNIDLFMTNIIAVKLGKYITANYSLDLIYDDDARLFGKNSTSPNLQVKSLIGVGFQAKF